MYLGFAFPSCLSMLNTLSCLLAVSMSSFENCQFNSLLHWVGLFASVLSSLSVLDVNHLSDVQSAKVFPCAVGCLFA